MTCLKCSYAYLLRGELKTVAARWRLEGQKAKISRWSIEAHTTRYKVSYWGMLDDLGVNYLKGFDGMMFGVGSEIC